MATANPASNLPTGRHSSTLPSVAILVSRNIRAPFHSARSKSFGSPSAAPAAGANSKTQVLCAARTQRNRNQAPLDRSSTNLSGDHPGTGGTRRETGTAQSSPSSHPSPYRRQAAASSCGGDEGRKVGPREQRSFPRPRHAMGTEAEAPTRSCRGHRRAGPSLPSPSPPPAQREARRGAGRGICARSQSTRGARGLGRRGGGARARPRSARIPRGA
jgi:hypothetical protein